MRITSVSVTAQRKLPHPAVDFATVSAMVTLSAELDREENVTVCTANLQHRAELLVEEHLDGVVAALRPQPPKSVADKMREATAQTTARLVEKHAK